MNEKTPTYEDMLPKIQARERNQVKADELAAILREEAVDWREKHNDNNGAVEREVFGGIYDLLINLASRIEQSTKPK